MRRVLVVAVLLLAACGPANRYPDAYKLNFMQSCQLNGSSEAHCTCIWNRVEAEIPVADFEAADAALRAGASIRSRRKSPRSTPPAAPRLNLVAVVLF